MTIKYLILEKCSNVCRFKLRDYETMKLHGEFEAETEDARLYLKLDVFEDFTEIASYRLN